MCIFSTISGLRSGLKHRRLDWENEIEVIKQGAALAVYLFPNMFLTMGLCVAAVALCFVTSGTYVLLMQIALYSLLCGIFYLLVNKEK